jgi:ATP synthase protein I
VADEPGKLRFMRKVAEQEKRKLEAKQIVTIWSGLGMMGLVGWSVAVPTMIGTALGIWLDKRYPGAHSWTLALLVAGLAIGCLNAWHWVAKENKEIHTQEKK